MFRSPKKLIRVAVSFVEGSDADTDDNGKLPWDLQDGLLKASLSGTVEAWAAYEFKKILPYSGGVLDQPLALLVKLMVMSVTYHTWQHKNRKDADWSKFTSMQMALISWIENDG